MDNLIEAIPRRSGAPAGQPPRGPVHFSLAGTPARERPDRYREFFGQSVVNLAVEPLVNASFEVDVTVQSMPGLQLLKGKVHGSRNRRTSKHLADGKGDFSLMVNRGGAYVLSQGEEELTLGDGEAALVSTAEPCSFMHKPPGGVLALRFPREQLTPLIGDADDRCLRPIARDTGALKLLTDYVDLAWDERTTASDDLRHMFISHVYDLAALSIGGARAAAETARLRGERAARLHALKRDIARHLENSDLSVAVLAARHHVTPRCVQRMFESEGTTFTSYLLEQRLARAYQRLNDLCCHGQKISAVAYDCGFNDVSYFNRAFRRQYGSAPSDVRAQARGHGISG